MRSHGKHALCVVLLACTASLTACLDGPTDGCRVGALSVSPTSITVAIGSNFQANVIFTLSNCQGEQAAVWSSDNAAIARVTSKGLITGAGIGGPTFIRAKLGAQTGVIAVTVIPAPVMR